MKLTLEEKQEWVKDLRPIDDVFFEVFADDREVITLRWMTVRQLHR